MLTGLSFHTQGFSATMRRTLGLQHGLRRVRETSRVGFSGSLLTLSLKVATRFVSHTCGQMLLRRHFQLVVQNSRPAPEPLA